MPPDLLHADFSTSDAVSLGGHFLHTRTMDRTLRTLSILEAHPHLQLDQNRDGKRLAADICAHILSFTEVVISQPRHSAKYMLFTVQLERYARAR